ncbi:MAG: 4Fe-4S binding protein [Syntrophobacteraceae bacterium]|nr:4Fe-4S binding protein [Syntrophobacteraceae bacterium]
MSSYYIYQDQKRCIGCRACEVHCKTENNVPVGPCYCKIIQVGPVVRGNIPRVHFVFMPCFHCEVPWCVSACPTGAMQKRSHDGIVFVDQALCVGCKACISACPWGAPQWNPGTGTVIKCDYCKDRIDRGLDPACVTGCTTAALRWVPPAESSRMRREFFARALAETGSVL